MNLRIAFVALVTLAITPTLGNADSDFASAYVGSGWDRLNLQLHSLADVGAAAGRATDSKDNAWRVFAGFRSSSNWSLEAAYVDFGNPAGQFAVSSSLGSYAVKMHGPAPSLIGAIPVGPLKLFDKVGYCFCDTETSMSLSSGTLLQASHSRSDLVHGACVGPTFPGHLNVRAEYERIHEQNASSSNERWLTAAWRI